ncbi:MAG TPA: methyltransferase dimerization domain-containing protein [Chloroflexota bacterium]|nr:methyltransferase dimerization domain-containing protein [Chloroflexota bacterium]
MPTPDRLLDSALAFWRSAVLLSANDLGLFAELAAGPREAGTLERRLGLLPDATADFLDALVALGLVEHSDGYYRNTPEASLFLDPAKAAYIGHWLAMASTAMRELADLTSRLRPGDANEKEHRPLNNQMWADIAGILRVAGAPNDV